MKKKIISALCASVILSACGGNKTSQSNETSCSTLSVFNATEYMKESVYKKFEQENGIKLVYDTFESNEAMYTKLSSGVTTYDVIIPSDYMIQNLISKGMIQKLDYSLLPNAKGFFKEVSSPRFDEKLQYSMPYMWGTVGLVYNKEKVSEEELHNEGWAILKNPKYKDRIYAYDSERDGFMPALKNLGYSLNSSSEKEINEAYEWLQEVNAKTAPIYVTDQILDGMISGEKDIAIAYSGDANSIISENKKMGYFTPNEGTNIWVDAMVISKDSKCKELAHKFINYILDPEVMKENAEEIGYTPSVESVAKELQKTVFSEISTYIPITTENDEFFEYDDARRKTFADLWLKVKAGN